PPPARRATSNAPTRSAPSSSPAASPSRTTPTAPPGPWCSATGVGAPRIHSAERRPSRALASGGILNCHPAPERLRLHAERQPFRSRRHPELGVLHGPFRGARLLVRRDQLERE